MAVRHKKTVLAILYKHFKDFELPLDIQYKSYVSIVGTREALNAVSIKRSFKAWKYALLALKNNYPELLNKPAPVQPVVKSKKKTQEDTPPMDSGLEALRAKTEMSDDGKDI